MTDGDPQAANERRLCARHLLQRPMTCAEHDPDLFRLIRRHESELDRWFTQRLGYRLHIDADTARLFKLGVVPHHRPLRAKSARALHPREYTLLALILASTAAGPAIISLRDLVAEVRSAAAEADIALAGDGPERRAFVAALKWMVECGLISEMFEHIDAFVADDQADAVLKVRPDRIALVPIATLIGAENPAELLARAERRGNSRQWMRCRMVEDPVLYRDDLTEVEWGELRRRLGDEERILDEMFALVLEARAEGIAAIDPTGALADQRFPTGGTVGHAALLLIERLATTSDDDPDRDPQQWTSRSQVVAQIHELIDINARRWSKDLVAAPERLARQVIDLLVGLRLAEVTDGADGAEGIDGAEANDGADEMPAEVPQSVSVDDGGERFDVVDLDVVVGSDEDDSADVDLGGVDLDEFEVAPALEPSRATGAGAGGRWIRLRPAAARFIAVESGGDPDDAPDRAEQVGLW